MSTKQYTIRKIPVSVDQILRKRAKQRGVSLNALIVMLLKQEAFWLNRNLLQRSRKSKTDQDWEHI